MPFVPRDSRKQLNAWLSPDAKEGWDSIALREGVSVTSLLEAIGCAMREGKMAEPGRRYWAAMFDAARLIDHERSRRGREPGSGH